MTLRGRFAEIIFENTDNGYTVGLFASEDDLLMVVGHLHHLSLQEELELSGDMVEHAKYGSQFLISSYKYVTPTDEQSILDFLASGTISGLGTAMAGRIVEVFGTRTFEVIEREPKRLLEISGIGKKTLERIQRSYQEIMGRRETLMFLQDLGLGPQRIATILSLYGDEARAVIEQTPYRLYLDFPNLGFQKVDQLALKLGFSRTDLQRVHAYVLSLLYKLQDEGHAYAPFESVLTQLAQELLLDHEDLRRDIQELQTLGHLFLEEDRLYLTKAYRAESFLAMNLRRIQLGKPQKLDYKEQVQSFCRLKEITLDEVQWQALEVMSSHALSIITGGPGTGKTTLIRSMCDLAERQHLKLLLAAPTGRAAKRMEEATLQEASTIHRLLEYKFSEDENMLYFERNRLNPLQADIIIIDEVSMVDMYLMASLFEAIEDGTRVVLIGDADQLASVGPGKVLKDLIDSGAIPVTELTHIFRQHAHSLIPLNARHIMRGSKEIYSEPEGDFFFMRHAKTQEVHDKLKELIGKRLPQYYGFDPIWDIQVLTPLKRGPLGTETVNALIQELLIPKDATQYRGFRLGDKVMQTKNDYTLAWRDRDSFEKGSGVFNGDIGEIIAIDERGRKLVVVFDKSREVEYSGENVNQLELAYAMTIHKSQGSEFPCVILLLGYVPELLSNRNVLYTGVTRAKKLLIMVGSSRTLQDMIEHVDSFKRNTFLKERLISEQVR